MSGPGGGYRWDCVRNVEELELWGNTLSLPREPQHRLPPGAPHPASPSGPRSSVPHLRYTCPEQGADCQLPPMRSCGSLALHPWRKGAPRVDPRGCPVPTPAVPWETVMVCGFQGRSFQRKWHRFGKCCGLNCHNLSPSSAAAQERALGLVPLDSFQNSPAQLACSRPAEAGPSAG